MKKQVKIKERNHLVPLVLFRKAGAHEKTNKAKRTKEKVELKKLVS